MWEKWPGEEGKKKVSQKGKREAKEGEEGLDDREIQCSGNISETGRAGGQNGHKYRKKDRNKAERETLECGQTEEAFIDGGKPWGGHRGDSTQGGTVEHLFVLWSTPPCGEFLQGTIITGVPDSSGNSLHYFLLVIS